MDSTTKWRNSQSFLIAATPKGSKESQRLPDREESNWGRYYRYATPQRCTYRRHSCHQREGIALLEYQDMPSLRDLAHDGVLCTSSNRSALNRGMWCGQSWQAVWTAYYVQSYTPAGSLFSSQAGCRDGPAL
jgi:hypothetical protein